MLIKTEKTLGMALWEMVAAGINIGIDTSQHFICKECWDNGIYQTDPCPDHEDFGHCLPEWFIERSVKYHGQYESKLLELTKGIPIMIDFNKLAEPFPIDKVSFRAGAAKSDGTSAQALAYIDSRDVMDRLDKVCGPANWQDDYTNGPQGGVLCGLSIKLNGEWVTKWDGAENTQFEEVKGGLSDAFKRAAVKWGIGRYLYGVPAIWVTTKPYTKGNKTSAQMTKESIEEARTKMRPYLLDLHLPGDMLSAHHAKILIERLEPNVNLIKEIFGEAAVPEVMTDIAAKNLVATKETVNKLKLANPPDMLIQIGLLYDRCYQATMNGEILDG